MTLVVATLFNAGHYEEGVAAFVHSLSRSGYEGRVWCGVGNIERSRLAKDFEGYILDGRIELRFLAVSPDYHIAMHKPRFMLDVAACEHDLTHIAFFDPDIVVKCGWHFVSQWCSKHIAAVGDENWLMPHSSPIRLQWMDVRRGLSLGLYPGEEPASLDIFCNAGFVALPIKRRGFLELWAGLTSRILQGDVAGEQQLLSRGGASSPEVSDSRTGHFTPLDQELFNVALMAFGRHTSLIGPEAMDFAPGGKIFSHATGSPKPWNKRYLRLALSGYPPSKRDGEVLRHGAGSLSQVGDHVHKRRLAAYRVSRAIGGVMHRTDY